MGWSDKERSAENGIRKNFLQSLEIKYCIKWVKIGIARLTILCVCHIIKKSNIYFDIIYIDPPYKLDMAVKSIDYILNNNLLSKDGVIIIETDEEERELEELKNIDVNIYNVKRYGRVKLIFLRRKE